MPQPTIQEVHVNRPLTEISIAYVQDQMNYAAGRMFPMIPVSKKSDLYFVYDRADFYRNEVKKRPPGAESAGTGWDLTTDSYAAEVYSLHHDVSDQIRANSDSPLDQDRDAAIFLTQQMMINMDQVFSEKYFQPATWTGSTTGGDITPAILWDVAGSAPVSDIRDQIYSVWSQRGFRPNKLLLGANVWAALQDNSDVTGRMSNDSLRVPNTALLANILELDEVVVAGGVSNSAAEGTAEATDFIMVNSALLVYANPTPSILQPSAGYNFSWTGLLGGAAGAPQISDFRLERNKSTRIEAEMAFDMKIVDSGLGVFFSNVVS